MQKEGKEGGQATIDQRGERTRIAGYALGESQTQYNSKVSRHAHLETGQRRLRKSM